MTIDTLAYAKSLEAAGVDRRAAEAHAEALNDAIARHILPDLATKTDLSATEQRLMMAIEQAAHQQSIRVFGWCLLLSGCWMPPCAAPRRTLNRAQVAQDDAVRGGPRFDRS